MIIEDLIYFDTTELSFTNLIFKHYTRATKIKLVSILISGLMLMLVSSLGYLLAEDLVPASAGLPTFLVGITLIGIALNFSHNKTQKVIQKKYKKALDGGKWNYRTIAKIRAMKIANFIERSKTKPDIGLIIDSLKDQKQKPRYNIVSHTIILGFITVILSAYLGALFQLPAKVRENRFEEMTRLLKVLLTLAVVIGSMIITLELTFVREYWEQRNSRHDRLIRALENYRLMQAEY